MKTGLLMLVGGAAATPTALEAFTATMVGTPAQCALIKCSGAATGCLADPTCAALASDALTCETAACLEKVAGASPDGATAALVSCAISQGCVTSASLRGSRVAVE